MSLSFQTQLHKTVAQAFLPVWSIPLQNQHRQECLCHFSGLLNATPSPLTLRRELPLERSPSRRQISQRIGVVNLPEHIIRQPDAVDSPAAVQRGAGGRANLGRVIEVLVVGLEKPPMRYPELFDAAIGIAVGPE